jgi:hypothetical protein
MAPDTELETSMDSIAESLFETPATQTPNRVAEAEDAPPKDADADEADTSDEVDPNDVDLLEASESEEADEEPYVDPDEVQYDVTVDGQPTKATLKELKAAYSGNKAIDMRVQQASEMRKHAEVMTTELMRQLNTQAEKLKQIDSILAEAEQQGIDWDTLRRTDPQKYLIEKDRLAELQHKRAIVQRNAEEARQQQAELMMRRQAAYASEEANVLIKKLPELADKAKAAKISENWNKTARNYGFSDDDVASIVDHRMLLVLNDAMKYRALVEAKKARTVNGKTKAAPKPLLRPGAQNFGQRMNNVKAEREALNRAAQTGSIDDVAATLLVPASRVRSKQTGF